MIPHGADGTVTRLTLDDLRCQLEECCAGRELSPGAAAELDRLRTVGTAEEIEAVVAHLIHLPVRRAADVDVDPETTAGFEARWAEHLDRVEAHRQLLGGTAYRLGREVSCHLVAEPDAQRRLDRLAEMCDPEMTNVRLLDAEEADAIVSDAYARGWRAGKENR